MRQIVLDTETTGMNQVGVYYEGHRIIEIGAVEIINRRLTGNNFHVYLKPDRLVDPYAFNIHGISDEFLFDKPTFLEIADEFFRYIYGAELIIHNALFDVGFIDYEFNKFNHNIPKIEDFCKVVDSLALARKMFPGKRNSLDSLCARYKIDNSKRKLHGALLDAQILSDIYLAMTSGQISIAFNEDFKRRKSNTSIQNPMYQFKKLNVIIANDSELKDHRSYLNLIQKKSGNCLWYI